MPYNYFDLMISIIILTITVLRQTDEFNKKKKKKRKQKKKDKKNKKKENKASSFHKRHLFLQVLNCEILFQAVVGVLTTPAPMQLSTPNLKSLILGSSWILFLLN